MQLLDNISDRQNNAFGDAENGCLLHFQNVDNQYRYNHKNNPNSTGKERDEETGYGYFGARYMDHELMTMWLSVDPMADKYPKISPYHYSQWNPITQKDPNGSFDIKIHRRIVERVAEDNGIIGFKKYLLSYGTGFYSDIILFPFTNVHVDGKHDAYDIAAVYNNARDGAMKNLKRGLYISAGRGFHTMADFYSHSNYLELYAQYASENGIKIEKIDDIPTFTEAQNDENLWAFLQDKLETGDYSIFNHNSVDVHSHNKMNKDNAESERGKMMFENTGSTYHDVAVAIATKAIDEAM